MQVGSEDRCSSPELLEFESDDDPEEIDVDGIVVPPSHMLNERAIRLEQQQAGQVLFSPKSNKLLTDMLDEVYAQLQPKRADWDARQTVIHFITKFVNHKIPGSSISAFGSFVMDLFTSSSDLDLSLNLSDGRLERTRNDKVHYLRKVAKALYGLQNGLRQSVQKIETVYRAAVPVVKFVEYKTGIECDISVENNDGVLKSRVLGMFSTMDSRFRQLCYLVKAWAKKHNVNSSKNGTLNSLSICLLVAFHLQTCSPPILPPFAVFMEGLDLPSIESCLKIVEARVRAYKDIGFGKGNTETVPELFASFFLKLIAVETLWGQGLCSSTYEGKWISKIWPKNHIGCISVEDFADRTQNVARSVSRKEFEMIYLVLQSTVSNLKEPVGDVLEAKDLRSYLFGSIRQRHRGSDHDSLISNSGRWSNGNGWSSGEKGVSTPNGRGFEAAPENPVYNDGGLWGQKASHPGYANRSQGGSRPGSRANGYRKVDQSVRVPKADPSFDARSSGDYRGFVNSPPYMQYVDSVPLKDRGNRGRAPKADSTFDARGSGEYRGVIPSRAYMQDLDSLPLKDRFNGVRDVKQASLHQGPGYGREEYPKSNDGKYVHRDVDFPTIDGDHGSRYPDGAGVGYPYAEPTQNGRMTYAAVGNSRSRNNQAAPTQALPTGGHHQHQRGHHRSRRGQRNRNHHQGSDSHGQQTYGTHGYPVHHEENLQWKVQPSQSFSVQ